MTSILNLCILIFVASASRAFSEWLIERSFYRPFHAGNPRGKCVPVTSQAFCPYYHWKSFPTVRDEAGSASIPGLLFARCPITIAWLIIAIIVATLNRMLKRWPWSHIGKKVLEFFPSLANFNTSASVILKFWASLISASGPHVLPTSPFWGSTAHSMRFMRIDTKASTTTSHATREITAYNGVGIPAIANTEPASSPRWGIFDTFDNQQASKTLSGKITNTRHDSPPQVFLGRYARRLGEETKRRVIIPYAAILQ